MQPKCTSNAKNSDRRKQSKFSDVRGIIFDQFPRIHVSFGRLIPRLFFFNEISLNYNGPINMQRFRRV